MMPTKGIPLPLVSYGGSSLFVTLACVGVLLNINEAGGIETCHKICTDLHRSRFKEND